MTEAVSAPLAGDSVNECRLTQCSGTGHCVHLPSPESTHYYLGFNGKGSRGGTGGCFPGLVLSAPCVHYPVC